MSLLNQNTGVVNGTCQAKAENDSLEPTLKEVFGAQRQDVVQLHARLVEHSKSNKSTNQCITFKEAFRVFFVKGKKQPMIKISLLDLGIDTVRRRIRT